MVERTLGHFVRWDGVYFAAIARDGYTYEHIGAFFPLYPLLVRVLARGVARLACGTLQRASCIVLAGALLSNACFVLAALVLRALGRAVLGRRGAGAAVADRAALLFCASPASIFFSALYTESLFALLSLLGLWALAARPWPRALAPAALALAAATATRSNGAVSCGFVLYAAAATVVPLDRVLCGTLPLRTALATLFRDRTATASTLRRAFCAGLAAVPACAAVLAPVVAVQVHAAHVWCAPAVRAAANPLSAWCDAPRVLGAVPNYYGHVQAAYWGQGFLHYWRAEQLPNFALYAPMLALVAHGTAAFFVPSRTHKAGSTAAPRLPPRAVVYVVHAAALALFALLCMHVQVGTRLLAAAAPAVYWYAAQLTLASRRGAALVLAYFASFFVVGTILFTNFFPWT